MTDPMWEEVERPPLPEPWDVREEPLTGWYVESRIIRVKDNYSKPEQRDADGKTNATIHVFNMMNGDGTMGKLVSVYGKPDLDGKLSQVNAGDLCRIIYEGQEDIGQGRKLARFTVKRATGAAPVSHSSQGDDGASADDDIPF